jgi:hypothetical protein
LPKQSATRPNPPACPVDPEVRTADPNAVVLKDACAPSGPVEKDKNPSRARSEPGPGNYNGTPGGEIDQTDRPH